MCGSPLLYALEICARRVVCRAGPAAVPAGIDSANTLFGAYGCARGHGTQQNTLIPTCVSHHRK